MPRNDGPAIILSTTDCCYVVAALEAYPLKGTITELIISVLTTSPEVRMEPGDRGVWFPSDSG